jgi:deazaflavin-dependent oxidoreductase (nitroreductase family)
MVRRTRSACFGCAAEPPYGDQIEDVGVPFCYVTTTGRRTGKPHTIEIWFAASPTGRTLYILTYPRSDTVRNLRRDANVTVRIGGEELRATARLVDPGTDEDAQARRLVVEKYQSPGASDLEFWGANSVLVAFDLA